MSPRPTYKAIWHFDRQSSVRDGQSWLDYTGTMYAFHDEVWQWAQENGCYDDLAMVYVNFAFNAVVATFTDKGSAVRAKLSLTAQEEQKISRR